MYHFRIAWLAFAAGWFTSSAHGQQGGWIQDQANATMCYWSRFRAATLKDTVYIDGGYLYWVRGMIDGATQQPVPDTNPLGLIYKYNFSQPFNASTNYSSILTNEAKGAGVVNTAPNYYDGALLANDDEFFLYGGLLDHSDADPEPNGNAVLEYIASQYGEAQTNFRPGFFNKELSENVTRYVAYGGAANAPSENKAWYFGGYRSDSWGPLYQSGSNASYDASNVSDTLITLDMSSQQEEFWRNASLPTGTRSRANPSVVWVPVGEQGILVVVGGVTYPNYTQSSQLSPNPAQSKKDGPSFMGNIDIYDIAGNKWYQQPADGAPPGLTMGCAVLGTAADYSSFNIYYYGGYDGLDLNSEFNDDVWILSLPSFMWMKVTSGKPGHGRAGQYCVTPYPDQMISIGGFRNSPGDQPNCLSSDNNNPPGIFQVYNLTSVRWQDSYDPNSWNNYGVPEMIHQMIGGDFGGGATMTTPSASGWAQTELADVFATPYATTKLTTYYPYASSGPGNATRGESQGGGGGGGGTPSYLAPVLGVVLGLAFVTAVIVAIILIRKKKLLRRKKDGSQHFDENGNRVMSWIKGQPDGKAPTVTTSDETQTQLGDLESRGVTPIRSPGHPHTNYIPEMEHAPLVELPDTSPQLELMGSMHAPTSLTTISESNRNPPFAPHPETPHAVSTPTGQSFFVNTASHDHASTTGSSHSPPPQFASPAQRPDSPPLGNNDAQFHSIASATDPIPNRNAVVSGVSGLSDRDAGHLRQISDATVSSARTGESGHTIQPDNAPQQPSSLSHQVVFEPPTSENSSPPLPVSPPSVDGTHEGLDYMSLSHRGAGSPLRRSVFREDEEDLGAGAGADAGDAPERR